MKNALIAMLSVACLYGCGASNKGLDAPIAGDTKEEFYKNCGKAYAEMKDTHPKEFSAMHYDDSGNSGVFDLSQPRDQVHFSQLIGTICTGVAAAAADVAVKENINLKTYRDFHVWSAKASIDSAISSIEYSKKEQLAETREMSENSKELLMRHVKNLKRQQVAYLALTGKAYGPQEVDLSFMGKPVVGTTGQTVPSALSVGDAPAVPPGETMATPVAESKSHLTISVVPSVALSSPVSSVSNSVEQAGPCKGLDLANPSTQLECLDRKYSTADKQLNDVYKQLAAGLDESRKAALKKEQITWIKDKEAKCPQAGKEKGGTLEPVAIAECKVQMTDQRLSYLRNYK